MRVLGENFNDNVRFIDGELRVNESFDVLAKKLKVGKDELRLYYIDGFVKDTVMQKLMLYFVSLKGLPDTADDFMFAHVAYVETDVVEDVDLMLQMVASGATLMLGSKFGRRAIILDTRTYPARETQEPEGDRVMRGSRDGFVETLIFNTALVRRRIRSSSLTMHYLTVGRDSKTDIVVSYMADRADLGYVEKLKKKLGSIDTDSLVMGHRSLAECLIKTRWYNPFPKIRTTERPDAAAAQLLEGSVLIFIDNSPQVMVLILCRNRTISIFRLLPELIFALFAILCFF